jgi:hypothetical protein
MIRWLTILLLALCGRVSADVPRQLEAIRGPTNRVDPGAATRRACYTGLLNRWGHVLDGYSYSDEPLGLRTNITRNLGLTTNSLAIRYDSIGQLTPWSGKEHGGPLRLNEQFGYGYNLPREPASAEKVGSPQAGANDLTRRAAEHRGDPVLRDFQFEPVYRTDDYAEQRGLEQLLQEKYDPPLNKHNPVDPANPNRQRYLDAAQSFLQGGTR